MKIKDLLAHPLNPNFMDGETTRLLSKSLKQFGSLSDIVFNTRNNSLVGGHHRVKEFNPEDPIIMTEKLEKPDDQVTVGYGHIKHLGALYFVRLVDWDEPTHKAAMIAANKIHGYFDKSLLSEIILDLDSNNIDLELTGFEGKELENLLAPIDINEKELDENLILASRNLSNVVLRG